MPQWERLKSLRDHFSGRVIEHEQLIPSDLGYEISKEEKPLGQPLS